MAVEFRIFPRRGLVYVRYTGTAIISESAEAFAAYMKHPDFRPGQKQLVDLSRVTAVEQNYAEILALQAQKADAFLADGAQTILVYYAPTPLAFRVATMIVRSWDGLDRLVALVQETEAQTLELLGQPERTLDALLLEVG